MVTIKRTFFILFLIFSILPNMALCQGLKGAPQGMRALSEPPPALPGKSDNERWNLFLKTQRTLIGMSRDNAVKLFGAGATYMKKEELTFKLTEENTPSKPGKLAYLELTLKFKRNAVSSFAVEAVYWGS